MNKLAVFIIFGLVISGCVATSKTVRPTSLPETKAPVAQEKVLPEILPAAGQSVTEIHPLVSDVPQQQVKMTYSQITNMIDEFLDIQSVETSSGQHKFLGVSEDNLVTLELIGGRDNILQASIKLIYPKHIEQVNTDLNNAMMLRFLRNAASGFEKWSTTVKDIANKFHTMDIGNREEDKIILGEKIVQIFYDKDAESITVTVRPK